MNNYARARQARFVNEYMIDLNATPAAIRAGYSKKTARKIGSAKPLKTSDCCCNRRTPDEAEGVAVIVGI